VRGRIALSPFSYISYNRPIDVGFSLSLACEPRIVRPLDEV
jgi:hypothetical protein